LIFFLVIIVLGYVFRFVARLYLKRFQNKYNQSQNQPKQRPEGEVYVSKTVKKEKVVDKDVGDYIDYEEVKE
jgi:hypothetical protein